MSVIIKCGFQKIDLSIFRSKSISKGWKLYESFHVSDVKEEIREDYEFRLISGVVLRETPGVQSTRKHENTYSPKVEVTSDRLIVNTDCSCKGGKGNCKHAAAICIYVNEENTRSKTDQPLLWNQPSKSVLDRYHKASRIEMFYVPATGKRHEEVFKFKDIENIRPEHLSENNIQNMLVKKELEHESLKEVRLERKRTEEAKLMILLEELYDLQIRSYVNYFLLNQKITGDLKIKFSREESHLENAFYKSNVFVDKAEWFKICLLSTGQSQSSTWHRERFIRITASSKAHRIKTRLTNFDKLATAFCKEKSNLYSIPALRYGFEMEEEARVRFQIVTNLIVSEVRLIISSRQPYLACSPDGLVHSENGFELLEIKCPYSCRDAYIANYEERIAYVPYLEFDEDCKIQLKKTDKYYTQVQISMYILCISVCHFFVYSQKQEIHITLQRDDYFLSALIPKIEHFYFTYFIKHVEALDM